MEASHEFWFDHEKLEVYREAIALIAWLKASSECSWACSRGTQHATTTRASERIES